MFTIILFLILALIMPSFLPTEVGYGIFESVWLSFSAGLILWFLTLFAIWIQKKLFTGVAKKTLGFILSCEVLLSLGVGLFYLGFLKPFNTVSPTLAVFVTLICYLISIAWIEYLFGGWEAAKRMVLFLFPISIPALLLGSLADATGTDESQWGDLMVALFFGLIALMIIFIPYFMQKSWRCRPLPDGEIKNRLEVLCRKLKFKCGGLNVWTIMNHSYTAAIIGIVPKFRYVMFTEKLLDRFPIESTEAVLAHEIGHSKYKHLLYYPFIGFTMMYLAFVGAAFFSDYLYEALKSVGQRYPGFYWKETDVFLLYLMLAAFLGLGLRFFFGFYSRLFERQADLYVFEAGIDASHMTHALNEIGNLTGYSHDTPNWHHYSLNERIRFLNAAKTDPALIAAHHRKVRLYIKLLFIFIVSVILLEIYFA